MKERKRVPFYETPCIHVYTGALKLNIFLGPSYLGSWHICKGLMPYYFPVIWQHVYFSNICTLHFGFCLNVEHEYPSNDQSRLISIFVYL